MYFVQWVCIICINLQQADVKHKIKRPCYTANRIGTPGSDWRFVSRKENSRAFISHPKNKIPFPLCLDFLSWCKPKTYFLLLLQILSGSFDIFESPWALLSEGKGSLLIFSQIPARENRRYWILSEFQMYGMKKTKMLCI